MTSHRFKACLLLLLLLGAGLRFAGLTRGSSDFLLSKDMVAGATTAFYHFHPDEVMILRAALAPVDPLDPAFTVYGLLPVYALRAALHLTMAAHERNHNALDHPDTARRAVMTARVLAILFSCLVLVVTAHLTWRHADPLAACVATLLVAVAPGVIQQAHFYIVDGLFSLLSLMAVGAILRAAEDQRKAWFAVAGLLIGATAAVKLTGLLLGPVLVLAHLWDRASAGEGRWWDRLDGALRSREVWLAGGVAALTLVILEPYLVGDPGLIFRHDTIEDFAASAAIAQGEVLRPWTLADVHTLPYLHHWTHLFPLIAGWPLTVAFLAGIAHALWRRSPAGLTILAWMGLYFALVGGLHAKHVRYLVPLVPLLALLSADMFSRLCRLQPLKSWRLVGALAVVTVSASTAVYGLAFTTIYTVEDSRIRAARWIHDNIPVGRRIAVESGGFSLSGLIAQDRHTLVRLHESRSFGARNYLTCWATQELLRRQLARSDYLAIADANRYLQFTAAPDVLPAAADFYNKLLAGEMGFDLVAHFDNPPRLAGIDFATDRPEPSFIGYDHPTVHVLRRRDDFSAVWADWSAQLYRSSACPDRALALVISLVKSGDLSQAGVQGRAAAQQYPDMLMAPFLEAYIHMVRDQGGPEQVSLKRYQAGYTDESHMGFMIPWASAMSLIGLGAHDLVTSVIVHGHRQLGTTHRGTVAALAIEVANALSECGEAGLAAEVDRLATEASPSAGIYMALGSALYTRGDLSGSSQAFARALELDGGLVAARVDMAWNLYLQGELSEAIELNRQILEAGPHKTAVCNLALACLAQGQVAAAESLYAHILADIGPEEATRIGAMDDLRDLAQRGPNAEVAHRIIETYWPGSERETLAPAAVSPP